MDFENVLAEAKNRMISKEEALVLFKKTESIENIFKLFEVASDVRNREAGKLIRLDGFMGALTPCEINPPCGYCWRATKFYDDKFQGNSLLTQKEIALGVKTMAETGTSTIELGGGTSSKSARLIKEAVKIVQENSNMEIWINVGPSLNEEDVLELKEMGVKGITSSLETINEDIFKKVKSGDSMEKRKELARIIDKAGVDFHSVLMVGLQKSYEDIIEHIFYLKEFKNLKWFLVTWLHSPPGTPLERWRQPSPLEAARVAAIARLIFRDIYIHTSGWQYIQLWLAAGCNRFVHAGASVHKHRGNGQRLPGHSGYTPIDAKIIEINNNVKFVNLLPVTARYVKEMGLEVEPGIEKFNLKV